MKTNFLLFVAVLVVNSAFGQLASNTNTSCVYTTIEDYISGRCNKNRPVEVQNLKQEKAFSQNGLTSFVYKLKESNTGKQLKDVFAADINNSTYFRIIEVNENLNEHAGNNRNVTSQKFIKAEKVLGYDVLDLKMEKKPAVLAGIGTAIAGTIYGLSSSDGAIEISAKRFGIGMGVALGGHFGIRRLGRGEKAIIFDKKNREFYIINDCFEMTSFFQNRGHSLDIDCANNEIPLDVLKNIIDGKEIPIMENEDNEISDKEVVSEISINEINTSQSESMSPSVEEVELSAEVVSSNKFTLYPHMDITEQEVTLTYNENDLIMNNTTIIDLECLNSSVCIKDGDCVMLDCESKASYLILKWNETTKEYYLELTNEATFRQSESIVNKRRKLRK